jgi:hypothetical protein
MGKGGIVIHCANCFNAKVTKDWIKARVNISGKMRYTHHYTHRVRCKYGLAETNKNGWVNIFTVHKMHPVNKHTCTDYQNMGDNIDEFLDSLPFDRENYLDTWRPNK